MSHLAVSQTQKHTSRYEKSHIGIGFSSSGEIWTQQCSNFFLSSGFLSNLSFISIKLFLYLPFISFFLQGSVWFVSSSVFPRYPSTINFQEIQTDHALNVRVNRVIISTVLCLFIVVEVFQPWRFRNINRDLGGQGMVDGRYCCKKPSIINSPCAPSSVKKIC